MSNAKKNERSLEGHYDYYGIPAYILKQRNGAYASGFFDPVEGIFKAGGSAKRILWDGIRLTDKEAKKLIREYSRSLPIFEEDGQTPEWILLPDEASMFLAQSDEIHEDMNPGNEDFPGKQGKTV
jgi:hypothetical protein